jgi:hypothetical protein
MATCGFSVTYERWTYEDAEHGDTADRGFVIENVSLRDAMRQGLEYQHPGWSGACEADCYPVTRNNPPRRLTFYRWNECTRENLETGISESRSLHFPAHITPSSAVRIARLFGCYGLRKN